MPFPGGAQLFFVYIPVEMEFVLCFCTLNGFDQHMLQGTGDAVACLF